MEFKEFFEELLNQVSGLAKESLKDFEEAAVKDGISYLNRTKAKLEKWTRMLRDGELKIEDYQDLVMGQKDLAEMESLKEAGLTLVRIDKFRNALINTIIDTAAKTFL
jgi:hypothetical protein